MSRELRWLEDPPGSIPTRVVLGCQHLECSVIPESATEEDGWISYAALCLNCGQPAPIHRQPRYNITIRSL